MRHCCNYLHCFLVYNIMPMIGQWNHPAWTSDVHLVWLENEPNMLRLELMSECRDHFGIEIWDQRVCGQPVFWRVRLFQVYSWGYACKSILTLDNNWTLLLYLGLNHITRVEHFFSLCWKYKRETYMHDVGKVDNVIEGITFVSEIEPCRHHRTFLEQWNRHIFRNRSMKLKISSPFPHSKFSW
jgi:hypothetical protein